MATSGTLVKFTCPNPKCKSRGGIPYSTLRKSDFLRHVHNSRLPCFTPSIISAGPTIPPKIVIENKIPTTDKKVEKVDTTCPFCHIKFSKSYYSNHLESCSIILSEIRKVHLSIIKLLKSIKQFGYKFKDCDGYIYLLHCQTETKNHGYDVFKVGMTTCQPYDRIRKYPGDVQVLKTMSTKNVVDTEKIILSKFRQSYDICQVLRNEYFSGDPCSMMRIIDEVVYSHNKIHMDIVSFSQKIEYLSDE